MCDYYSNMHSFRLHVTFVEWNLRIQAYIGIRIKQNIKVRHSLLKLQWQTKIEHITKTTDEYLSQVNFALMCQIQIFRAKCTQ